VEDAVTARPDREIRIDPDAGIPDLIRRLTDDSKRLAQDEIHLAKLELAENTHVAMRGTLYMAIAFGAGVVALLAVTVLLVSAIGAAVGHNYWLGALITGLVEVGVAAWMITHGLAAYKKPSYTFAATRAELSEMAKWVKSPRGD
jgi:uncharacterized membrane protein YqjE